MRQPNILFFTCHDLGRHLSCYGHATMRTPALQALADEGVRFDNVFCTAPQCSPSRASLHTGRYPHAAGVLGLAHSPFGWRLPPTERHLAQLLAEAGYATELVGMQHLIERGRAEELGYERVLPVAPAREEAEAAAERLRELAASERPFYLEVGFEEPHRPFDFGGARPDDNLGVEVPPYLPDGPGTQQDMAAFQGAVHAMDEAVGRVLAALDEAGLAQTTWVIFTSDHGIAMPRAKGMLYDPGIEVSLLMRWPEPGAGLAGGAVVAQMLSNVDVVPTILEGLGLALPGNLHGRSFWPLLRQSPYTPRTEVFAEKTFHTYYEPMRCVRTPTHKYIVNFEVSTAVDVPADVRESPAYALLAQEFDQVRDHVELYDLAADPWEQENLTGRPEVAGTEADLRGRLLQWMRETQDPLLEGPVASPYYHESIRRLLG
jgi:N-sulfoglucosamine sulfohydrolase